jgi:hypothetical protein
VSPRKHRATALQTPMRGEKCPSNYRSEGPAAVGESHPPPWGILELESE